MQLSDNMKKYIIRAFKLVVFIAILGTINLTIGKYLSSTAHKSNEMWNYYHSVNDADTLILGTSVTDMVTEYVVNEYTGRKCINMGTPSQYFATSRELLEKGASEKPVDTVILMMGFDALERKEDLIASVSVEKAYYDSVGFKDKIIAYFLNNIRYSFDKNNIDTSNSINKWMSWTVSSLMNFNQIKTNYEKKLYYKDMEIIPAGEKLVYKRIPMTDAGELPGEYKRQIRDIKAISINEESVNILRQMGLYCYNNGMTFIVIVSPHKSGYSQSFGDDYEKIDALTGSLSQSVGATYLNLNDNHYVTDVLTDEYFEDSEHVRDDGKEIASAVLSDILNLLTGKRN